MKMRRSASGQNRSASGQKPLLRSWRSAPALVLICAGGALVGCGAGTSPSARVSGLSLASVSQAGPSADGAPPSNPSVPFRFFGPSSFWNEPLPANAPLDPTSTEAVAGFDALIAAEEQTRGGPWINTTAFSIPVYTVPADQRTVRVRLDHTPAEPALQAAWDAVPLPPAAAPAIGSDHSLVVWQPSTDRLWEFWRLAHGASGWYASWGGAMQHVSSNPGVYGPEAWPGAKPLWGTSASSMLGVGGLISLEDLKLGHINHALSILIPEVRAGVYASPAQRTDGKSTNPLALPEGAHLRLNPNLDLATLHLPRLTLMIAEAAQRYGIYVKDRGGIVTFQAQDPIPTGTNPYTGPDGYFEGQTPRELLASFPWSELQLLKMELHRKQQFRRRRRRAIGRRRRISELRPA